MVDGQRVRLEDKVRILCLGPTMDEYASLAEAA